MKFEELIADGWARHEDEPQAVHDALARSVVRVTDEAQLHAFARLLTHVHAEHLDDRDAGVAVLDTLRIRFEPDSRVGYRPATTAIGTLRFIDGDSGALDRLSGEERTSALATSASALAWRGSLDLAMPTFRRALAEASQGLPDGSAALRALASAGNNLAVMLERKPDRDTDQTTAMVEFADAALHYWQRAGGWLQEERAHYRCARSRIAAGRAHEAIACAERCLSTCESHAAPAYERFFAYVAGALANRAAGRRDEFAHWSMLARGQHALLGDDERASCSDELAELAAGREHRLSDA